MTDSPLAVSHEGQFPSVTVSFNLRTGAMLDQGVSAALKAIERLRLPDTITVQPAGDAATQQEQNFQQPIMILYRAWHSS